MFKLPLKAMMRCSASVGERSIDERVHSEWTSLDAVDFIRCVVAIYPRASKCATNLDLWDQ